MTPRSLFSDAEDALLWHLRTIKKTTWLKIALRFPGKSLQTVSNRYYYLKTNYTIAARNERIAIARPDPAPSPRLAPTIAASPRAVSTAALVADAELRHRVALVGLTGAIFGDPAPGQSALDAKRAGEAP